MSTRANRKSLKKRILVYLGLVLVLSISASILGLFFFSKNPEFLSPLGKNDVNISVFEKKLRDRNILFSTVNAMGEAYVINIPNGGEVKFAKNKDIEKQVSSLQRILRELTIEGKPFKSIDFSYDNPVVAYE